MLTNKEIKEAKQRCGLCLGYFVMGANTNEIHKYSGHGCAGGARSAMKKFWPDFDFTEYGNRRRQGYTTLTDEQKQSIKKLYLTDGLGAKAVAKQIGVTRWNVQRFLKNQDWYDSTRAKAHLTISKLGIIKKNQVSDLPEWRRYQRKLEATRRSKRTRRRNDLPLFQYAVRESQRLAYYDNPRTDEDRQREMHRYRTDERFWLKNNLRKRLNKFVSKSQKVRGFENYTGCDVDELREWMESLFEPWMTWDNKGQWHIDHIVPCSAFDLTDYAQQNACFNWRNLRPMHGRLNIVKGNCLEAAAEAIESHPRQDVMRELIEMVSPFVTLPCNTNEHV